MELKETAEFFSKLWFEKKGLVASLLIVTLFVATTFNGSLNAYKLIGLILVVDFLVFFTWWISRQPPKTHENKIGFLISIGCSNDEESLQLQEDFIRPLQQLIKSGNAGSAFEILLMPPHISTTITDTEKAQDLFNKCKAHFMIFGHVRVREINGKENHIIELEGKVAHSPIPVKTSQLLSNEFSELLPRKVLLDKENDFFSFQFTSEWTDIVSRYIIGFAAAVSGDLDYGEKLYLDVKERLHSKDTKFPIYSKLKERTPLRISELYLIRARKCYQKWSENKSETHYLNQTEEFFNHLVPQHSGKEILNLKAILEFVLRKDVPKAIGLLKQINAQHDALWHLNIAFLYGYQGQLKTAIRHYRLAARLPDIQPENFAQIENFIDWILSNEQKACQLYYCLAFFNWKIKGDQLAAIKDFECFLANTKENEYPAERKLTITWLNELRLNLPSLEL